MGWRRRRAVAPHPSKDQRGIHQSIPDEVLLKMEEVPKWLETAGLGILPEQAEGVLSSTPTPNAAVLVAGDVDPSRWIGATVFE
jgi:hypothetical protein